MFGHVNKLTYLLMSHEATCCSNLSRRLVASCVSASKDFRFIPIELIRYKRGSVRKAREAHLMNKAKTLHPFGKNRRDEARQWHIWHLFTHGLQTLSRVFILTFICNGFFSRIYVELSHFTLLFFRGRQRNVQRFKTHVQNHCSDYFKNLFFGDVLVAVAVVVC